jgi:hypothetical protein
MLPGFNTNVRHGGVLFHVQTEDSGRAHPHVITHLYHGGTILASEKRGYAEHVEAPDLTRRVRELMDAQHHAMLERLRAGELDEQIEQRLGPDVFKAGSSGSKSKSGSNTQRAGDSEPEPTIPPEIAKPYAAPARTTPILPPQPAALAAQPAASAAGAERPLDELILDYLVEAARRRKRRAE